MDSVGVSAAVKKAKKVNFHFSRPHNFFELNPKNFIHFSLFHFFHFFTFFQRLKDGDLQNNIKFWAKIKSEKVKKVKTSSYFSS